MEPLNPIPKQPDKVKTAILTSKPAKAHYDAVVSNMKQLRQAMDMQTKRVQEYNSLKERDSQMSTANAIAESEKRMAAQRADELHKSAIEINRAKIEALKQ